MNRLALLPLLALAACANPPVKQAEAPSSQPPLAREAAAVLAYLDDRELPDGAEQVYHRRMLPLRLLDSGRMVRAVAYVANRGCRLYVGRLSPERAAAAIAAGVFFSVGVTMKLAMAKIESSLLRTP